MRRRRGSRAPCTRARCAPISRTTSPPSSSRSPCCRRRSRSTAPAVHYCGAHRIGHGVRLRESGDLLNYVNDHRIPLEMCPSSNVQTRSVAGFDSHPLKFYFDFGLRVTVNTDNRLITDTTSTKELWLCHERMGFTLDDLVTVVVQGFKSAFLPYREKADLLKQVNDEIAGV